MFDRNVFFSVYLLRFFLVNVVVSYLLFYLNSGVIGVLVVCSIFQISNVSVDDGILVRKLLRDLNNDLDLEFMVIEKIGI